MADRGKAQDGVRLCLQPCRILDGQIIDDSAKEQVVLTWVATCSRFKIANSRDSMKILRVASPGDFVGMMTVKPGSEDTTFFHLSTDDRRPTLRWLERKRRGFSERISEVYRLVWADWGSRVSYDSYRPGM